MSLYDIEDKPAQGGETPFTGLITAATAASNFLVQLAGCDSKWMEMSHRRDSARRLRHDQLFKNAMEQSIGSAETPNQTPIQLI